MAVHPEAAPGAVHVFYSYAHEDEEARDRLATFLATLRRQRLISECHDRMITGGKPWRGEISAHLEAADVILALVSPDFLASDYCYDVEMRTALAKHEAGTARVIPIILEYCDWDTTPLAELQAFPRDARPISAWTNRNEAWLIVTKGIRAVVEELRQQRS